MILIICIVPLFNISSITDLKNPKAFLPKIYTLLELHNIFPIDRYCANTYLANTDLRNGTNWFRSKSLKVSY